MAKPRLEGFWTFDGNRLNMSDRSVIDSMFEVFEGTPSSIDRLSTHDMLSYTFRKARISFDDLFALLQKVVDKYGKEIDAIHLSWYDTQDGISKKVKIDYSNLVEPEVTYKITETKREKGVIKIP